MEESVLTFVKGMNTDLDNSVVSNGMYRYAINFRLGNYSSESSNNIGSLENVIGNSRIDMPDITSGIIVGQANVRDYIVIFVKHDDYDAIYSLKLDSDGSSLSEFNTVYTDEDSTTKLGFPSDNSIQAIGRQETESILKIYWVDGQNPIRYIDILDDNSDKEVASLEIVPPYIIDYPYAAKLIDGGEYKAGAVQYACQLYNKNGASTTYSPLSNIVRLSALSDSEEGGSERDENTGKSVEVRLNTNSFDNRFDRLRLISIFYPSLNDVPHIRVVTEVVNSEDLTIIDTGSYIDELTLEEFTSFAETDYTPKSIESKNNYLFASNIREKVFDTEVLNNWDARAYRFASSDESSLTLGDLVVVTSDKVVFNKTVKFRKTALSGVDSSSPWEDLWFYEDSIIHIVVPTDFEPGATAYYDGEVNPDGNSVKDVYNYDGTYLTFDGNREIVGLKDVISTDEEFDFPSDWDKEEWNSEEGSAVGSVSKIYTVNGNSYIIDSNSISEDPDHWTVPEDHDCINRYNKLKPSSDEMYKFQTDGETLGGEGPNIKYWFECKDDYRGPIDNNLSEPTKIGVEKKEGTSSAIPCQLGEVYRVAIGFYNKKGQVSFVKWIGDIKTPDHSSTYYNGPLKESDLDRGHAHSDGVELHTSYLFMKVEVKNFPDDDSIQGWQIFRVERKEKDRSVLYSGMISPTVYNSGGDGDFGGGDVYRPHSKLNDGEYYPMIPVDGSISSNSNFEYTEGDNSDKIVEFISPDINFFKPGIEISNLELRLNRIIKRENSNYVNTSSGNTSVSFTKFGESLPLYEDYSTAENLNEIYYDIDEYRYVKPVHEHSTQAITIKGERYINQIFFADDGGDNYGGRGSGVILGLSEGVYDKLWDNTTNYDDLSEWYAYGQLVRDVHESRYGGLSYYARLNNEYIPFSAYESIDNSTTATVFGDNHISMFQFLRGLWWDTVTDEKQSLQESIAFPVESSIDIKFRLDNIQRYLNDGSSWVVDGMILETMTPQETVEKGIELQPETYDPEIGDLYRYNSVYSRSPDVKKYYPKPFDFDEENKNDVQVRVSEKKINGEYTDSWTIFKPANFIEVDTAYGPVNTMRYFRDKLMFWQDKAFGVLAVNDRAVIQDNNPGQLSLGTGGILNRFDYITTEIGCTSNKSIDSSDSAIYWYDKLNHQLIEFSDRIKYLDTEKGIRSYILDKDKSDDVLVKVDTDDREVIFAFPGDNVLIYNQYTQTFIGEFSYIPYMLFEDYRGNLLSVPTDDKYQIWTHKSGDRGSFYGNVSDSEIEIIMNENYNLVKVFDSLEFPSRAIGSTETGIFDDTFTYLQVYNNYQNSGGYELVKDGDYTTSTLPLRRRERNWNTFIPRNAVDEDVSKDPYIFNPYIINKSRKFRERMRDNHLILNMKYDNSSGNKLYVPYVKVSYRYSIR